MTDVDTLPSRGDTVPTDQLMDRKPLRLSEMQSSDLPEQRARLLAAKLSLPHQGFILGRPRLRAMVDPVRAGGVIHIVAGPGYGKTAFIVSLLSTVEGSTVYYAVDESDRDPIRFMTYLMSGLGMEPADGFTSPSWSWSEGGGHDAAVLELAARLVDFMADHAGQPTLVAIDDLHLVDSSTHVLAALEMIARGLPPCWTLLLSSRRRIPLRIDGVTLGGRLVRLKDRDMRLTPREVSAWARQNWSVRLQPSGARSLWRATEGWPAALVLLGQHLLFRRSDITPAEIYRAVGQGRDLRAYLERHILSDLDPVSAKTILAAALLPRVIFPRDELFLPGPRGQAETILEEFVSRGFLVTRASERAYVLHPLLRGFAEREAWRTEAATGMIARAAEHLERSGELHSSASLYLRSGLLQAAARPLRALCLSSLNAAINVAPDEWLNLIPDNAADDRPVNPWLLVTRGRLLQQQTNYGAAETLYERAARSLSAEGDREGLLAVLLTSAFCLFNQGMWEESLAVTKRCRSLAKSAEEKVEVLMAEGNILISLCRWDEGVENWERALALAPTSDRSALTRRVDFQRARLFYALGRFRTARQWVEKAIDLGANSPTPIHAMALNGAAILAYLTGNYELSSRYSDQCLRLVRTRGWCLVEASSLLNQAAVALARWDYREALARIREAQVLAVKAGDAEECFWAEDMLGDLCRRNQNAERALVHHRTALDIVDKNRLAIFERARAVAAIGMDLAVLGRDAEARPPLEEAIRTSRRWGLMSSLVPALLYHGWLHARSGNEQEASRSLSEAMRLAAEHGHVHFLAQEAAVAMPILALCDRFEAGAFLRNSILPLLPERLRDYLQKLTTGGTYPTDVSLGPFRRCRLALSSTIPPQGTGPIAPGLIEGIKCLTERERQVLKMISVGMPNKVIGTELFISEKTVKTHANHVFRKLGVTSRLQATLAFQSYQRSQRLGRET